MFEPLNLNAMTDEALAELLRQDTDTDTLLQAADEYARRLEQQGIEIPAAEVAWHQFGIDYMPAETADKTAKGRSSRRIWRKITAVAAAVAISFILLTVTAYAAGIPLWSAVLEWTQQTLRFVWEDALTPGDASLILQKYGVTEDGVPGWIPEGYELTAFEFGETDVGIRHTVGYTQENNTVIFSVSPYNKNSNHQFHQSGETETYDANGIRYYIFPNLKRMVAVWMESGCECKISGEFTKETLKDILDQMN